MFLAYNPALPQMHAIESVLVFEFQSKIDPDSQFTKIIILILISIISEAYKKMKYVFSKLILLMLNCEYTTACC